MSASPPPMLRVHTDELATAAASLVVAYERVGIAIDALEKATGIQFREILAKEVSDASQEAQA